jgi:hypothetical protein
MIDFKNKSSECLSKAIADAGHFVRFHDNVLECSDEAAVQAIIDAYTLDALKTGKCALVLAHAKALRDKVVAAVSPGEMASWPIKAAEATKFDTTGDATQCPMLSAEAASRGITVAELVVKVDGNATMFSTLEATIGGTDGKHRDAIKAMTTFEDVAAYDFSSGWPAV